MILVYPFNCFKNVLCPENIYQYISLEKYWHQAVLVESKRKFLSKGVVHVVQLPNLLSKGYTYVSALPTCIYVVSRNWFMYVIYGITEKERGFMWNL